MISINLDRNRTRPEQGFPSAVAFRYPPQFGYRVTDRYASLGYRLDQVPICKFIAQVPANAKDDLSTEVSTLEQAMSAWTITHVGHESTFLVQLPVHTRAP